MKTCRAVLWCALLLALTGCQVPGRELSAYRDAFGQARTAGEEVLLDYGVARDEYEALGAAQEREAPEPQDPAKRLAFDPDMVGSPPADAVVVRMKAWAVLARYNEALVSLAEGRDPAELNAAADGLMQSIATLSTDIAADIAPFGDVIKAVLAQAQRAIEVKKFREVVRAADPLVQQLSAYLLDDTRNFYEIRRGLRNIKYSRTTDRIVDLRSGIEAGLEGRAEVDPTGEFGSAEVVERVDAALRRLPERGEEIWVQVPDA
ncbi:MAG: hypothetical protein ACYTGG_13415, partial [Planctomycetota bacterium]